MAGHGDDQVLGDLLHLDGPASPARTRREVASEPAVISATPSEYPLTYVTKGYLAGPSKNPRLTFSGRSFLRLLSGGVGAPEAALCL